MYSESGFNPPKRACNGSVALPKQISDGVACGWLGASNSNGTPACGTPCPSSLVGVTNQIAFDLITDEQNGHLASGNSTTPLRHLQPLETGRSRVASSIETLSAMS